MLARVEVGAVSGRKDGDGGDDDSFPAAGRIAWSWCADEALEFDLPCCRGLVGFWGPALLACCCSPSAVEGVKYDWNFFMMMVVTTGPGGFRGSPGAPCHFDVNSTTAPD
jgi:hypothetical protein